MVYCLILNNINIKYWLILIFLLFLFSQIRFVSKYDDPNGEIFDRGILRINGGYLYTTSIVVVDEFEDQDVHRIGISSRKCKFPQENQNMRTYKYYNRKACITECAEEQIMRMCNCSLPLEELVESWNQGLSHCIEDDWKIAYVVHFINFIGIQFACLLSALRTPVHQIHVSI